MGRLPHSLTRFVLFLSLGALLAACGGGGGGGGGGGVQPPPATYSITGDVLSAITDGPVPDVRVSLSGATTATTTTDASGRYTFSGLANGSYTVSVSLANAAFSPESRAVTVSGSNVGGVGFLAIRAAPLVTNVTFLPKSMVSNQQYRTSLLVAAGNLVFSDSSEQPVKKRSLGGTEVTALAGRFGNPENVVMKGQSLYWVDGGVLNRTSFDGKTTVLDRGARESSTGVTADVVIDEAHAYWVNSVATLDCSPPCTFVIRKVPLDGSAPATLVTVKRPVVALAAQGNLLYWEEAFMEPVTPGCNCGSTIKSIAKVGGPVTVLVDGLLNGAGPPVPPGHIAGSWMPTGGLALTPDEIVFASAGNPYYVRAVPQSGGTVRTLVSVPSPAELARNSLRDISVAGSGVYWIDSGNKALNSVPLAGGAVTALASGLPLPSDLGVPVAMTVTGAHAYWTEPGNVVGCCLRLGTGSVKRIPLAGGTATTIASGLDRPGGVDVDAETVAWFEMWRLARRPNSSGEILTVASGIAADMPRIASDGTHVYVLDTDLIKRVPMAGGPVEKLAVARFGAYNDFSTVGQDIATDGRYVYWTIKEGAGAPVVQKVPVAGGAPVTLALEALVPKPQDCYWRIAVDARNVYWSAGSATLPVGCAVKKVPLEGGAITTIVDYPRLSDFTIDANTLFFGELGAYPGTIQRTPIDGGGISLVATSVVPWVMTNTTSEIIWLDPWEGAIRVFDKAAGTPVTGAVTIPFDLAMDPLRAAEALVVDSSGLYVTETATGTIYRIY